MNVVMTYINLFNGEAVSGSKESANPFTFPTEPALTASTRVRCDKINEEKRF